MPDSRPYTELLAAYQKVNEAHKALISQREAWERLAGEMRKMGKIASVPLRDLFP